MTLVLHLYSNGLIRGLSYLLALKLGGNSVALEAMRLYSQGERPADIAVKLGISRSRVRGWVQRWFTLSRLNEYYLRKALDAVEDIPTLVGKTISGQYVCTVCGAALTEKERANHIATKHRDIIESYIQVFLNGGKV
jgi:hypothetical protein